MLAFESARVCGQGTAGSMPCSDGNSYRNYRYGCYYRDSLAGSGLVLSDYSNFLNNNNVGENGTWNSEVGI